MVSASSEKIAERRIRLGMVGGGEGAFIGAVHRIAARLDDHFELVAGALSASPDKAIRSGLALGLEPKRNYPDFKLMVRQERSRADGIEAVAIVTPNASHAPIAEAFLRAGIHVICDKPLSTDLKSALRLEKIAKASGCLFALTHNYSGYPMVRQARAMVEAGELGRIRVILVEYAQDWLATPLEESGQKQAAWRTDPAISGAGGCIGDIGTHAYQLADYITGLPLDAVSAEVTTFLPGRRLDDHVQMMLRYANGARGILWASQVAVGNENALRIRLYGEKAGLEWAQEHPNQLFFTPLGEARRVLSRAGAGLHAAAARMTRLPTGHPEGYLEGFANLYSEIAEAIRARRLGSAPAPECHFPTIEDGVKGMAFIEAALRSAQAGGRWQKPKRA